MHVQRTRIKRRLSSGSAPVRVSGSVRRLTVSATAGRVGLGLSLVRVGTGPKLFLVWQPVGPGREPEALGHGPVYSRAPPLARRPGASSARLAAVAPGGNSESLESDSDWARAGPGPGRRGGTTGNLKRARAARRDPATSGRLLGRASGVPTVTPTLWTWQALELSIRVSGLASCPWTRTGWHRDRD